MTESLVAFLKMQTRGQMIGLLLMQVSIFFFIGVVASQAGVYEAQVEACSSKFTYGEAYTKYNYRSADRLCRDYIDGKISLPK